ncbi:TetR/AcrR family transcriptional regulator [Beijerinckiaceae bacterium]|nr:TetR/AcrR family transcriptional regulator [Beijerinckiaceae bacterium]
MLLLSTSIKPESSPYHHGDLRRALVEAGLQLLEKRGPAHVSLREVSRVAGVSHNAPYRHFDSREALLAAMAADGFETLRAAMARAAEGKQSLERLRALGLAYVGFAREKPAVYLLMFGPELAKDPFPALKAVAEQSFEALRQAIDAITPEETRAAAAIGAWALVHGLAHLIADRQLPPELFDPADDEGLIENVLAIYRLGLMRQDERRGN